MIIIPMLGKSSRFFDAGYTVPKYELPLADKTVFDWVLESFRVAFDSQHFVFTVRSDFDAEPFVESCIRKAGINSAEIIPIDFETQGQAETVAITLKEARLEEADEKLLVFNADSFLTDFNFPIEEEFGDGFLEVFLGEGEHWSFIEPGPDNTVLRTTEKERISAYASNGLYGFRTPEIFLAGFEQMVRRNYTVKGEYYVAPLYNLLIESGLEIRYRLASEDSSVFCGVPHEYESLIEGNWRGF